jgi:hypothetical protein
MTITLELVSFTVLILGAVFGAWWRVEARIRGSEEVARKAIKELAEFKLIAAEKYASHEHLKEVEQRLVSAIDKLSDQIEVFPDRLTRIVREALDRD